MRSQNAVAAVVVSVVFAVIAILAVNLRIYAQRLKGNSIKIDDYFIIAGLIVALGLCTTAIYCASSAGLGWPARDLPRVGVVFQKLVFSGQILWAVAIFLIRTGLLLFYRRIFVTKAFRLADTIALTLNGALFVTNFFGTIFSYSWNRTSQTSIDYPVWLIVQGALNMVMDIATLCLPLFVIKSLHMSTKRKFMLAGIFWLGLFCVIASIVRLTYFVQLAALTQKNRSFSTITFYCFVWSVIEPCTSIIAACLPAYGPIITEGRGIKSLIHNVRSIFSLHSTTTPKNSVGGGDWKDEPRDAQKAWQGLPHDSTK